MMAASGAVEDPKRVAQAGYKGLRRGKRMQVLPRIVHLTLAGLGNTPLRGWAMAKDPVKDQREGVEDLK
jgi:hypothetical protein